MATRSRSGAKAPERICAPLTTRESLTKAGATIIEPEVAGEVVLDGEKFTLPVCIFTHEHLMALNEQKPFPRDTECRVENYMYPLFSPKTGSAQMAVPPPDVKIKKAKPGDGQEMLETLFLDYLNGVATNVLGGMSIILHERLPSAFHSPIKDREHVLHIFAECLPVPRFETVSPATIFGVPAEIDGCLYPCLLPGIRRGIILSDGDHEVLQVIGNNIYLFFDPLSLYGLGETAAFLIFRRTVALAINGWIKGDQGSSDEEPPLGLNSENLDELACTFVAERKKHTIQHLQGQEQEVRALEDALREAKKILAGTKRFWRILDEGGFHRSGTDGMKKDYARILAHPLVHSASVVPGKGFAVLTKTIVIRHEGKAYRIGTFTVHFELEGAALIWAEESCHPTGEPHPHISAHNGQCLGNIGATVDDALVEHEYADALNYIILWLESYTPDLVAWHKIEEWPLDDANTTNTTEVTHECERA